MQGRRAQEPARSLALRSAGPVLYPAFHSRPGAL